jgi:hypothetical protein
MPETLNGRPAINKQYFPPHSGVLEKKCHKLKE